MRRLVGSHRIDSHTARQIGRKQSLGIKLAFEFKQFPESRIDPVELLRPQDLVLGKVNLAAAHDRRVNQPINQRVTTCMNNLCMQGISVDEVFEKVTSVLAQRGASITTLETSVA